MSFLKAIVFYIAPYYLKGRRRSAKRPILGPKRLLFFSCMCDCHSLRFRLGRSQHSCIKYHPAKILERHTIFARRKLQKLGEKYSYNRTLINPFFRIYFLSRVLDEINSKRVNFFGVFFIHMKTFLIFTNTVDVMLK